MVSGTLYKEITIVEESVQLLSDPEKYGVSTKSLFQLLNASTSSASSGIHTKMVDFSNLMALGQILAEQRNFVCDDPQQAISIAKFVYGTLSTHVYINHVDATKITDTSVHDKENGNGSTTGGDIKYAPDLRLAVKNVLVLFVSFLNRYIELINDRGNHHDDELESTIQNLILLFNVSILSKLHNLFRGIHPQLILKHDALTGLYT